MTTKTDILKRFVSGKFSFSDYLLVTYWFKNKEHSPDLKIIMEEEWNYTDNTVDKAERLNKILELLHKQIKSETQESLTKVQKIYHRFSRIAAIFFIPALISIALLSYLTFHTTGTPESYTEIYAPIGTRAKFQLPDGTEGWLNSGSSIKFPVRFKNRNVEISGEAWFDVTHQKSKEFRVITPYFDVKVLGTRFNVVAYNNEETAEIILEKGKVAILDKNDELKTELVPDQQVIYNKSTRQLTKATIDSKSYTSWKDGLLVFKNVPMSEIARRLERKYNAEIILHGNSLKSSVFRATFSDERLDEICKMMSEVAPIEYKIHKRNKQDDGTFPKNKIEMWLKGTNE